MGLSRISCSRRKHPCVGLHFQEKASVSSHPRRRGDGDSESREFDSQPGHKNFLCPGRAWFLLLSSWKCEIVCVLLTSVSLKLIKIKLIYATTSSWDKKIGGWKVSDADWFYFSFYDPSTILFYFNFFIRSESIRPGLAVRVDLASHAGVFRGTRFSSLPCGE